MFTASGWPKYSHWHPWSQRSAMYSPISIHTCSCPVFLTGGWGGYTSRYTFDGHSITVYVNSPFGANAFLLSVLLIWVSTFRVQYAPEHLCNDRFIGYSFPYSPLVLSFLSASHTHLAMLSLNILCGNNCRAVQEMLPSIWMATCVNTVCNKCMYTHIMCNVSCSELYCYIIVIFRGRYGAKDFAVLCVEHTFCVREG